MYQIKNRWVIGTAPGWNVCFIHSTNLEKNQRPTDVQWFTTGDMKRIEIEFRENEVSVN